MTSPKRWPGAFSSTNIYLGKCNVIWLHFLAKYNKTWSVKELVKSDVTKKMTRCFFLFNITLLVTFDQSDSFYFSPKPRCFYLFNIWPFGLFFIFLQNLGRSSLLLPERVPTSMDSSWRFLKRCWYDYDMQIICWWFADDTLVK